MHESVQARQGWLEDLVSTLSAGEKGQIAAAIKVLIGKANQLDQQSESEQ
jgi:hypothetical protein